MAQFKITGGQSLEGEITVGGAKNAALKLMAASLMTPETVTLHNVPDIRDIRTMINIIQDMGGEVTMADHTVTLNCADISGKPDYQLVKHMRASAVIIGPLVARFGSVRIPQPGGCLLGARPIDTHIHALEQLGVTCLEDGDYFEFAVPQGALTGGKVILDEMSVTATENVLMAASLARGKSEIHLAASEPEIINLAELLQIMGARISGAGTSIIRIEGAGQLAGAEHGIIPDRIEAGTFAIAAAVSRGEVRIKNINPNHLEIVLKKMEQANVQYILEDDGTVLHVKPTTILNPVSVDTRPYPGFPTDLQAPFSVLMTQAKGTSKIFETMYDGRLGYATELAKMGADVSTADAHTLIVHGPTPLYGKHITTFDIRAGATLIIAALIAQGESIIDRVELVDRGYEHIEERLCKLGADIKRI